MTIDELIKELQDVAAAHGGDTLVRLDYELAWDHSIAALSLQAECTDGPNEIIYEERGDG